MTATSSLSWALVIATYQREKILPICLRLATEQTRKPSEIIIVDSSDYWECTRYSVMDEIAASHPDIRWVYVAAEQRSAAFQRNQGVQLATADIVFLIDDDALMYPTCAEEIMRVYEADPDERVKGVQAFPDEIPPTEAVNDTKHYSVESKKQLLSNSIIRALFRFFCKHLLLMDSQINFIPYDGHYPTHPIPDGVSQLNVEPTLFLAGFRMTFRRSAILQNPFESLLRYYTAWEDVDASYRTSRHGLLLTALDAKIHHFYSASGRVSRLHIVALSSLNQAVCLRKYSLNLQRDICAFYFLMARRVLAEILKDLLTRRWSFPQIKGILIALRYSFKVFTLPTESLSKWYPHLQKRILEIN